MKSFMICKLCLNKSFFFFKDNDLKVKKVKWVVQKYLPMLNEFLPLEINYIPIYFIYSTNTD